MPRTITRIRLFGGLVVFGLVAFATVQFVSYAKKGTAAPDAAAITINSHTMTDTAGTVDGNADPNDTLTHTVTLTNTGDATAASVQLSSTLISQLSPAGGTGLVNIGPVVNPDTYATIGNVKMDIPDGGTDVLANDTLPDGGGSLSVTKFGFTQATAGANNAGTTQTSANGASVTLNANGSLTYDPAVGFTGTDDIWYTASDGTLTSIGKVTVTTANKIWFINNNVGACPAAPCDGRLSHPFTDTSTFQTANTGAAGKPAAGDYVFIFTNTAGVPVSYVGNITPLNNQRFIGQGASATIQSITGFSQPSGTNNLPGTAVNGPTLTTTAAVSNAFTLNAGISATLRGFTIGNTTGFKIGSGASFGTLTASEVALTGSGGALNLVSGNLSGSFTSTASSSSPGSANLTLSNVGGTFNFGNTTITGSGAQGIFVSASTLTGTFGTTGVSGAAGQGISISGTSGPITFGATTVSSVGTQGILIGTSTGNMTFGATTVTGGSDGVSFQNNANTGHLIQFASLNSTAGGAGNAFNHAVNGGNVTVTGLATLAGNTANVVNIDSLAATYAVNFSGGATLTKAGAGNSGLNINASAGNVTVVGTLTVGTGGGRFPTAGVTVLGGTGTFSLGTVSIFTNGFTGISTTTDGTLNVTNGTVDTGAGTAINVAGPAGITTLGVTLTTVNSTGGTNGVNITNANGTASLGSGALSGASGSEFVVSGSNPTVSYNGTITQNNAARVVDIQGTTGNTVQLPGTITGGTSSLGIHIGDTSAVNGNVTFADLDLGSSSNLCPARMSATAITITGGAGTYNLGAVNACTTGSGQGIVSTTDGTINATGLFDSSGAAAINIDGPAGLATLGMTLTKVAASGGTNGIILIDTNGTFSITGAGSVVQGGDNSGGTLQNQTGDAISLNNAANVSLNNLNIQSSGNNGVFGTNSVSNFSFTNGKINNVGDASAESCLSFSTLNAVNAIGTFTFTNNQCTLVEAEGVDIKNYGTSTISDANISNNVFSDTGDVATPGSAVVLTINSTASGQTPTLTKAELNNNSITDFRAGAGFVVQANSQFGATATLGTAGSLTNVVSVSGNLMNGGNGGIGNQPDRFITSALNGPGTAAVNVTNNGTAGNKIRNIDGVGIELSLFGPGTMSSTVSGNFMAVNNAVASSGLGIGCATDADASTPENGVYNLIIDSNNVSLTDGPTIYALAREQLCTLNVRITNNTAAAPNTTTAARAGIRVDSGSSGSDNTLCLDLRTNNTAGSTNVGTATTSPGINLRKQGSVSTTNDFGIEGMASTSTPGVENYVNGLNTSTSGTFGTGGTALLSATAGFSNCSAAPNAPAPIADEIYPTAEQEEAFAGLVKDSRSRDSFMPAAAPQEIALPALPYAEDDREPIRVPVFITRGEENARQIASVVETPAANITFQANDLTTLGSIAAATFEPSASLLGNNATAEIVATPSSVSTEDGPSFLAELYDKLTASISPTVEAGGGTVTSTPTFNLPAGSTVTITYQTTVDPGPYPAGLNNLNNIATINWGPGSSVSEAAPGATIALDARPSISVTTNDGAGATQPGVTLVYAVTATNATIANGQDATGVVLTQTVPANTTFNAGASSAGWNCVPNGNAASICTNNVGALSAQNGNNTVAKNFAVDVVGAYPATANGVITLADTASVADDGANGANQNLTPNNTDTNNVNGVWIGTTSTAWTVATNWSNGVLPDFLNAPQNISIPAAAGGGPATAPTLSTVVNVNSVFFSGKDLTIDSGGELIVQANKLLSLQANKILIGLNNGGLVHLASGATATRTTGQVNTAFRKDFVSGAIADGVADKNTDNATSPDAPDATFIYPVGTATGFFPVTAAVTAGSTGSLTVQTFDGPQPSLNPATSLARRWTLSSTGSMQADLTFDYNTTATPGVEANYRPTRVTGGVPKVFTEVCPAGPCVNEASNFIFLPAVTTFNGDFTASELAPTAAGVSVAGRVVDANGAPLRGVRVTLNDGTGHTLSTLSNAFGYYRFDSVTAGGSYLLAAQARGYTFTPRVVSVSDTIADADLQALP